MKTVTTTQNFKITKNKNSVHYGKKREPVQWQYEALEAPDVAEFDATKIATIVNDSLERMAKQQFIENGEDWEFIPDPEKITVDELYNELTSETTRKRTVTKETLDRCASFYELHAPELLGKESKAVNAGARVIREKLVPIAANTQALEVFSNTVLEFIEKCNEVSDERVDIAEGLDSNIEVLEWICKHCEYLIDESKQDLASML